MNKTLTKEYNYVVTQIIGHLKQVISELDIKINNIKGNISQKENKSCFESSYISNVISNIEVILKEEKKSDYEIYINGYFSDIFESYVLLLLDYFKLNKDNNMIYEEVLQKCYKLTYSARKIIEECNSFLSSLTNTINYENNKYILDDRLLINLENLKSISKLIASKKSKIIKIFPFVQIFGLPVLLISLIFLIIPMFYEISYFAQSFSEVKELTYERGDKESYKKYQEEQRKITAKYEKLKEENKVMQVSYKISSIGIKIFSIYFIIGHLLFQILKHSSGKNLASAKYVLAYLRMDVSLFLVFVSLTQYKMYMVESAHLGCEEAIYKLGFLYEIGFFSKTSIDAERNKAIDCYSRILHNKKALKRYNRLRKMV